MKPTDQVYRWMTPCPRTISRDATMAEARDLMRRAAIRHLPVLDEGTLIGLVSDADLSFVERFTDPRTTPVFAAMRPDPCIAVPSAPLADLAAEMAERRCGAAVIIDGCNVVGVFTTSDALRAIGEHAGRARAQLDAAR